MGWVLVGLLFAADAILPARSSRPASEFQGLPQRPPATAQAPQVSPLVTPSAPEPDMNSSLVELARTQREPENLPAVEPKAAAAMASAVHHQKKPAARREASHKPQKPRQRTVVRQRPRQSDEFGQSFAWSWQGDPSWGGRPMNNERRSSSWDNRPFRGGF